MDWRAGPTRLANHQSPLSRHRWRETKLFIQDWLIPVWLPNGVSGSPESAALVSGGWIGLLPEEFRDRGVQTDEVTTIGTGSEWCDGW
jgi:hypothetical protein